MRMIILAAGNGTRMGHNMPKICLSLGDGTIGDRLIRQAGDVPVTIVVGFQAQVVMSQFGDRVTYVHNKDWKNGGSSKSALCAFAVYKEPCVLVYGDIVMADTDVHKMMTLEDTAGVRIKDCCGSFLRLGDGLIDESSTEPISDITYSGIMNITEPELFIPHSELGSVGYAVVGYRYERIFSINNNTQAELERSRKWIKSLS